MENAWVGAGNNNPDVVFVTLGTGVGGGNVADGNLIHGVAGAGGEVDILLLSRILVLSVPVAIKAVLKQWLQQQVSSVLHVI